MKENPILKKKKLCLNPLYTLESFYSPPAPSTPPPLLAPILPAGPAHQHFCFNFIDFGQSELDSWAPDVVCLSFFFLFFTHRVKIISVKKLS